MSPLLRTLCLAIALAHAGAVLPPGAAAERPAAEGPSAHAAAMEHGTAHAHPAGEEDLPPCHRTAAETWKARCPCGCGAAPAAGTAAHAMDPGLLAARTVSPPRVRTPAPAPRTDAVPDAEGEPPEPVPLPA